jgi:simple sugar transport system substrate-binding protein
MQNHFGSKVKSIYYEEVPETFEASKVMRDAIKKGADIVFATSFGFAEPLKGTAQFFPHIAFEHCTGISTTSNIRTYSAKTWEGAYLAGYLASKKSLNECIGVLGSIPIPEVIQCVNAYALGAKAANPKCKVLLRWADGWFEPNIESALAERLFKDGADIIYQLTDSEEVLSTARKLRKHAIVSNSDMSAIYPESQLGAVVVDWSPYYIKSLNDCLTKSWRTDANEWGLLENTINFTWSQEKISSEISREIASIRDSIVQNKNRIWSGPIKTQSGRLIVGSGDSMSLKAIAEMNWLIDGIEGYLPTRR